MVCNINLINRIVMRKMDFMKTVAAVSLAVFSLGSCNKAEDPGKDDPSESEEEEVLAENTIQYDGVSKPVACAFFEDYFGYSLAAISLEDGYKSATDIVENAGSEYITVMLLPDLVNTGKVDLLSHLDGTSFGINGLVSGFPDLEVGVEASGISAAVLEFSVAEKGETVLKFDITFDDGKVYSCHVKGKYAIPDENNHLTIGGEADLVKSVFFERMEGTLLLYMTPQEVYTGDDLYNCKTYLSVGLSEELATGAKLDIADIPEEKFFSVLSDEFGEYETVLLAGDLAGASGTVGITVKDAEKNMFAVSLDVVLGDGTTLSCAYDGVFQPYYVAPENGYSVGGGPVETINSVVVDQTSSDVWTLWFANEAGLTTVEAISASSDPVRLTISPDYCDGTEHGFSQDGNMTITYGGKTYSKANGDKGTVSVGLDGNEAVVYFYQYAIELEGNYSGGVTIIK